MSTNSFSISFNKSVRFWIAQYRDKSDPKKWRTKWLPKDIANELEAQQFMVTWYASYLAGTTDKPVAVGVKTLKAIIPMWLKLRYKDVHTKHSSYKTWENVANNWILNGKSHFVIDELDMEKDFTSSTIRNWIDSLSGKTILYKVKVLSLVFEDAIAEGWVELENNPVKGSGVQKLKKNLRRNQENNAVVSYFTEEEVTKLLTVFHPKMRDYRKVMYLLAIATGARENEIMGLQWKDINYKTATLKIRRQLLRGGSAPITDIQELQAKKFSKNEIAAWPTAVYGLPKFDSSREVPIHPMLLSVLKVYQEKGWRMHVGKNPTSDDPIFPLGRYWWKKDAVGQFYRGDKISFTFKADLVRLGLPVDFYDAEKDKTIPFVFHSFRHTFSTLLFSCGVDIGVIGRWMGHKAKSITMKHYTAKTYEADWNNICKMVLPEKMELFGETVTAAKNFVPAKLIAV